jgi:hypothetical protein
VSVGVDVGVRVGERVSVDEGLGEGGKVDVIGMLVTVGVNSLLGVGESVGIMMAVGVGETLIVVTVPLKFIFKPNARRPRARASGSAVSSQPRIFLGKKPRRIKANAPEKTAIVK